MKYDFDRKINRKLTESAKWNFYEEDILPLWVADMDFISPQPVIEALIDRVKHGVFGYPMPQPELLEVITERMVEHYRWHIVPDDIVLIPGVVTGFNLVCHGVAKPGEGALIQTPVYPPFLSAPDNAGLIKQEMQLSVDSLGFYSIDTHQFSQSINDQTRLFILCNPHNPVGRVFRKEELEQMAEICLKNNMTICSDEIHCDLIFNDHTHIPIASLDPEIADKTITLMSPSKTYNIAGLDFSIAIVQNKELRRKLIQARQGLVGGVNIMGLAAGLAAYKSGREWLEDVMNYLEANKNLLYDYVDSELPGITMVKPEGTFLAWLDCRNSIIEKNPYSFFLENAQVALNDGTTFGNGGAGHVRLNFACPQSMLVEGLERMKQALITAC